MAIANSTNTDETGVQTFSATTGDWTGSTTTQYIVQLGDTGNKLTGVSGTGTAAQVLTSNGAGSAPTWQDAPTATDLHVARFIVHPSGTSVGANYTTIAAAIAAASAGDTIHIQSKATDYIENLTLPAGINLVAYAADANTPNVTIRGKITMTAAGTSSISGIRLKTNGDNIISITGSNAVNLNLTNCYLDLTNFTGISMNNANANLNIYYSKGDFGQTGIAIFSVTACDTLNFEYFYFGPTIGNNSTANTIASGNLRRWWTRFTNPTSITGDASLADRWARTECSSANATCLTMNTSSTNCFSFYCLYSSGSATAIVITAGRLQVGHGFISTTAANAITGAGQLDIGGTVFDQTTTTSVTTTNYFGEGPRIGLGGTGNAQIMCGTGSPSGSVTAPKGTLYLRTDGSSSSTRAYINTNSSTGWTAITTAS